MSRCDVRAPIAGLPQCRLENGHVGAHEYAPELTAKVDDHRQFQCPFCSGICAPATASGVPAMAHTEPYCKEFDQAKDALAFVKACNEEFARRRRS